MPEIKTTISIDIYCKMCNTIINHTSAKGKDIYVPMCPRCKKDIRADGFKSGKEEGE